MVKKTDPAEQRTAVALLDCPVSEASLLLARREGDIGGNPGKSLAAIRVETRKDRDRAYLVRRHHGRHRR